MKIRQIILYALAHLVMYRKALAKSLLIPFAALFAIALIEDNGFQSYFYIILIKVISALLYTLVAITTHRLILLGPNFIAKWGIYKPTWREAYFIFYSICLGLLMIPVSFVSTIPIIGGVATLFLVVYLMGRFSLVFPAIATDKKWSFRDSWNATQEHQLIMAIVAGLFPVIVGILEVLLGYVPHMNWLVMLVSLSTTVFVIASLSVVFRVITQSES